MRHYSGCNPNTTRRESYEECQAVQKRSHYNTELFCKAIFSKHKSYFISFMLKILLTGAGPLLTIMLSRSLIYFLTALDARLFFTTAGLLVLLNLVIGICSNAISRHMDLVHNDVQLHLED